MVTQGDNLKHLKWLRRVTGRASEAHLVCTLDTGSIRSILIDGNELGFGQKFVTEVATSDELGHGDLL
jgi:hypothetical protein